MDAVIAVERLDGVCAKIRLPRGELSVGALRRQVAQHWAWPPSRAVLVLGGERLDDDQLELERLRLPSDSAVVRCWIAPPPQPSRAPRKDSERSALLVVAARDLLSAACSVDAVVYVGIALWCLSARLMGQVGFGNPYILLSVFVMVFRNLGQRQAGELSAYNVFNDGFQELLGQLRAEHLEADLIDPNRLARR